MGPGVCIMGPKFEEKSANKVASKVKIHVFESVL